jgi:hypothetical protein
MRKHPLTEWEEGFPYDLLAQVGITPDSSMEEIRDDAYFILMEQGLMTAQVRRALDTLRYPDRRLGVDFFMIHEEHDYPAAGGGMEERGEADVGGEACGS